MSAVQPASTYYRDRVATWNVSRDFYSKFVSDCLADIAPDLIISARVKALESFVAKVHRDDVPRSAPSIRDAVGVRVVCGSLRDAEAVLDAILSSELHVTEVEHRAPEVDQLGYAGIHSFIDGAGIASAPRGIVEAELQIKTRAQDAWSVVSHGLIYKPHGASMGPANDLRRRVNRLSALTELFDDEVGTVIEMRRHDPALSLVVQAEEIGAEYDLLVGRARRVHTPSTTMVELLGAYGTDESPSEKVRAYVNENAERLREVVETISPASDAYVDNTHWIMLVPEALVVAERAANARFCLADVARRGSYEAAIRSVASAFGSPLP